MAPTAMTDSASAPLPDIPRFFEASWRLYRARAVRLLTIAAGGSLAAVAVGAAVMMAGAFAVAFFGMTPALWATVGVVFISIILWAMSWVQAAMIECALADDPGPGVWEAYKRSWSKVGAFSWVCVLYVLLTLGGMCVLVLPGVFLTVALLFAPIAVVADGLSGLAALRRSMDDTKGRYWAVLARVTGAGMATTLPAMIPVVGSLVGAVTGPFSLAALVVLYKDLKAARPAEPSPSGRGWVLGLSAAGLLLPVALAITLVPRIVARAPQTLEAIKQVMRNPSDPEAPTKIFEILASAGSADESVSTGATLAQSPAFATAASTAAVPAPAAAPPPQPPAR